MKNKKQTKIRKNLFYKILSGVLIASSITFLGIIFYIDLLPIKYSLMLLFAILLFDIINIILINLKRLKKKIKAVISIFIIFVVLIMTIASFYVGKTVGVLINNGDSKYKLENYSVIVLKENDYKKIKDIKGQEVGYFQNSTTYKQANDKILEQVKVDFKAYKTSDSLVNDLLDSKIEVIVIEDSIKNIMEEELPEFASSTIVIYTFSIKSEVETTLKEVDVTKEPFAIYISGIDTYGKISSVSRSDVNMVMVVNPKIHQILLISIPRDYYVQLHGTTGNKDKLTHAGIYGIDMSVQTIEDLLELDINYYIKVNFTSVIDIVDALGGLDVYSEYSFISFSNFKFKKGMNSVNGEQALDFARTRKAFTDGDRQRGKNQQALIEAIVRKVTDKSIITKYSSLLDAINGKYQTNMSIKKITSLIKMQLEDMSPWTITSHSLTGIDGKDYTYTYNQLLYVMKPDEESLDKAIELIDSVLNDEQLDNSYDNLGGSSNKVTQVQIDTNPIQTPDDSGTEESSNEISNEEDNTIKDKETSSEDGETDEKIDSKDENKQPEDDSKDEDKEQTSSPEIDEEDNNTQDPLEPIIPSEEQTEE